MIKQKLTVTITKMISVTRITLIPKLFFQASLYRAHCAVIAIAQPSCFVIDYVICMCLVVHVFVMCFESG